MNTKIKHSRYTCGIQPKYHFKISQTKEPNEIIKREKKGEAKKRDCHDGKSGFGLPSTLAAAVAAIVVVIIIVVFYCLRFVYLRIVSVTVFISVFCAIVVACFSHFVVVFFFERSTTGPSVQRSKWNIAFNEKLI